MRVEIEQDARLKVPEITIRCPAIDEDILRIVAMLRVQEQKITGILDGDYHLLDAKAILYFESVDKRTFCYTQEAVYECPLRLYEIEELLSNTSFVRISKACILNIDHLDSVKVLINGRLEARLLNGEKLIINRHYVSAFKKKLG